MDTNDINGVNNYLYIPIIWLILLVYQPMATLLLTARIAFIVGIIYGLVNLKLSDIIEGFLELGIQVRVFCFLFLFIFLVSLGLGFLFSILIRAGVSADIIVGGLSLLVIPLIAGFVHYLQKRGWIG